MPGPEYTSINPKSLIAGKSVVTASNVSQPTMTVYATTGKNTGAAVVVFLGGDFKFLAMDLEGTEVCDWLTSRGITCVVPVEMHLYAQGGHAFGLRPMANPITRWPALAERWMSAIGMIPSAGQ